MREPEPTEQKKLTAEDLQKIDAEIRRKLYLFGTMLSEEYQMTHKVPKDNETRAFLLNMFASYSTARSVERQEGLMNQMHGTMNQMHRESERMTHLTRHIKILTVTVVILSIVQIAMPALKQLWQIVSNFCGVTLG